MAKAHVPLQKLVLISVSLLSCLPITALFLWLLIRVETLDFTGEFLSIDFAFVAALILMNILIAKKLSRYLDHTIQPFVVAAKHIHHSKNKIPLEKLRTTEFYQLATAFNSLSDQVEQQKRQLKKQQEHDKTLLLQRVADNLPGMIFQSKLTASGSILTYFLSYGLEHIYANAEKPQEQRVHELINSFNVDAFPELLKIMRKSAHSMQPYHFDIEAINLVGETYWLSISGQPSIKKGEVHWDGVALDITERKNYETKMWQQAHIDAITQLNNRSSFNKHLKALCKQEALRPFSLLFFDLDGFKNVNDKHGHHIGDQVLIKFSQQLSLVFSPLESSFLARVGGDEFCVIATNKADLIKQTDNLLESLSLPVDINGIQIYIKVSVGMANWPESGHSAEAILHKADIAMYSSKEVGGHQLRQ